LRRPNLLKYLAGPEIGGGNLLSDTAPEEKAAELRAQSGTHYKQMRRETTARGGV
jgi:UDPglucose--hexose-1-phosphate uridylyltransferase